METMETGQEDQLVEVHTVKYSHERENVEKEGKDRETKKTRKMWVIKKRLGKITGSTLWRKVICIPNVPVYLNA